MRVILDANILLSYLLSRRRQGAVVQVVETCLADDTIQLILPEELLEGITKAVAEKAYLHSNIAPSRLKQFIQQLSSIAEVPPRFAETTVGLSRDPDDDYLLAYGLVEDVDYLVTGDKDLLILRQIEEVSIVRVQDFLAIIIAGTDS